MPDKIVPPLQVSDLLLALLMAALLIFVVSLVREPARQRFMAVFVAGAGAAYFNGGLGLWELVFTAAATACAYRGLDSYGYIALAWLLHTAWDVVHHLYGSPILFFQPTSSAGCALSDVLIAVWCLLGAPSILPARKMAGPTPEPLGPEASR